MSKIEVKLNPDVTPAGSDLSIVNAARRSFNQRSEWGYNIKEEATGATSEGQLIWEEISRKKFLKEKDQRLLHFLARGMTADDFEAFVEDLAALGSCIERSDVPETPEDMKKQLYKWRNTPTHDTPFNHTFISFECKAPIFVHRQLVKHEYLICSEFSRRYKTDGIEFYEPDYWRKAAPNKKQGSLEEPVEVCGSIPACYEDNALRSYKLLLDAGVAPEQARMVLPLSTMTEWTWSGTLGAFAKMCRERLHPDAQYEARVVAQKIYEYLKEYYPVSAKALVEGPDV